MKICLQCEARFDAAGWTCPECGVAPPTFEGFPAFAPELAAANDGFEPEFFQRLADSEPRHFWFRARNALIVKCLRSHFSGARSFLEIGCGTGWVLSQVCDKFPSMRCVGSELYSEGLRFAAERAPGTALMQMDAARMPFDEEFDVIGAFDVLEHIENDTDVLQEMYRSVKPGGGILLTVPQHPWLWTVADEFSHHKRRYTRTEFQQKIEAAGFEVQRITSFVSLLLPMLILSRVRMPKRVEAFDPLTEYGLPPTVDRILEGILRIEQSWIGRGISLPAGGSLLAIAKRIRA